MRYFSMLMWLLLVAVTAKAQQKARVVNANDGQGIAGATILNKATKSKTSSDAEGYFTLAHTPKSYELEISHQSYHTLTQRVQLPLKAALTITLEAKVNTLEEVMVSTGYEKLPKERATGSFTVVGSEKLGEQYGIDLISRLEGVASGFSVDRKTNSASIMVRGLSTIRGPRGPLVVLDDFPYEGDLANINPNDIVSVVMLKDAAAASIWGAKAANGVIVLTSKRGKFNSGLKMQYQVMGQAVQAPDPFYMRQMQVSDFIAVERMLFGHGYYTSTENATSKAPLSPVVELLIAKRDGKITTEQLEQQLAAVAEGNLQSDYRRYMYQTGYAQQHHLQLSDGKEGYTWLLNGGFDDLVGTLDERTKRTSLRASQDFSFGKKIKLQTTLQYTGFRSHSGKTDISSLSTANGNLPPYTRLTDDNGNAIPIMRNYRTAFIAEAAQKGLLNWEYSPLEDYKHNTSIGQRNNLMGNLQFTYQVFKGLSVSANYKYENEQYTHTNLQDEQSFNARNYVNQFSQVTAGAVIRPVPLGGILDISENRIAVHQGRAQLNYNGTFGQHAVNFLGGAEMRERRDASTTERAYGYNTELMTNVAVDYTKAYPSYVNGQNSFILNRQGYGAALNRFVSFFANGAYTYLNRYTISASARRDASNLFGLSANDKWTPLWSVGWGWNIARERFLKDKLFSQLKLRGSYGLSGNVDPAMTAVTTIAYGNASPYTLQPAANFVNYSNPQLKWEQTATLNLGLDFGFFNNALTGSIEYFIKNGDNLYGLEMIDYTGGIGNSILKNAAKMQAKGLDVNLNAQYQTGKLRWHTDLFVNFYKDKVVDYYLTSKQASGYLRGDIGITGLAGYPVHSLFSFASAGLNPINGNPRGFLNGQVSEDYATFMGVNTTIEDLEYNGPALPTHTWAVGNTLAFGRFSLAFRLSAKFGYYFRRSTIHYTNLFGNRAGHADFALRWQQPGDEMFTSVPSMIYPADTRRDSFYYGTAATISKGDHLRLQYVNLKYAFNIKPAHTPKRFPVEVVLSANNLGILWQAEAQGIDPDYAGFPAQRNISLALKANF